jgi:branched-chain amino acid transport system ATP-binding protein
MSSEYAIEAKDLTTGYAGVPVVRDLNLVVGPGEVVALLGPNGAGKTTTLLALSGLVPVLGGSAAVLGRPVPRGKGKAYLVPRRGMAHVSEDRSLFYQLSVRENIKLGMRRGRISMKRIFDYFPELEPLQKRRAGLLSGGEQQMLALGRAIASDPKVMVVDEMSLGLAPIIVERLLPVLRRIADERGTALLIVEQQVHMALEVADRAYVLTHGSLMMEGRAAELRERRDLLESSYLGGAAL